MKSLLLGLVAILAFAPNAYAANIVYRETPLDQNDLSGDNLNPTKINLSAGVNSIIGSTTADPLDRDFWSITIPSGYTLSQIILAKYVGLDTTPPNQGFFAVQTGLGIDDSIVNATIPQKLPLLGATTIGEGEGKKVDSNILDALGKSEPIRGFSFIGFSGALAPGNYTFWIQETAGGIQEYQLDFVLSKTPEPSTILGMGLLLGGSILWKGKRRFAK